MAKKKAIRCSLVAICTGNNSIEDSEYTRHRKSASGNHTTQEKPSSADWELARKTRRLSIGEKIQYYGLDLGLAFGYYSTKASRLV